MSSVEQAKKGGLQKCRKTLTVYYKHFNQCLQHNISDWRYIIGMPDTFSKPPKLTNHLVLCSWPYSRTTTPTVKYVNGYVHALYENHLNLRLFFSYKLRVLDKDSTELLI